MIRNTLPVNSEEVKNLIDTTSATFFVSSFNDNKKITDIEFFSKRLDDLKELRRICLNEELAFFEKLGCASGNSRESFNKFKKKLHDINEKNKSCSIENLQRVVLFDPYVTQILDDFDWETVKQRVENIEWEIDDLGDDNLDNVSDIAMSAIINQFNETLSTSSGKKEFFVDSANWKDKQGKKRADVGLRRIFEITRDKANPKIFRLIVKNDGGKEQKASGELKDKIFRTLQLRDGARADQVVTSQARANFKNYIVKLISSYLQFNDSSFKKYLEHQIMENIDKYDLSRSFASLKGFLEEVWANSLLDYLFSGTDWKSEPVGNIKNIIGAKGEIPVDAVLDVFKFQIKSFTLNEGEYTVRESDKQIGTFIKDRAQMNMSEALIAFFGSYQFNQPFSKPLYKNPKMSDWANLSVYKRDVYSGFNNLENKFTPVFGAYVDKIIGLDKVFQADYKIFENEENYRNTFFIVNDKFIPSSSILTVIINNIMVQRQRSIIQFSINKISNNPNKENYTFESIIKNDHFEYDTDKSGEKTQKKKGKGSIDQPISVLDVANQVNISYEIKLNFNLILKIAYRDAEKY